MEIADRMKFGVVYAPVTPSHQTPSHRNEYTRLITSDNLERFYRLFPWDITPTTDDRPFFFQNKRLRDEMTIKLDRSILFGGGFDTLRTVSLVSLTLVVIFILLPWRDSRRSPSDGSIARSRPSRYFACLGSGFMLIEIGLMQRFVLFLGHPVYSLSVILFTLDARRRAGKRAEPPHRQESGDDDRARHSG